MLVANNERYKNHFFPRLYMELNEMHMKVIREVLLENHFFTITLFLLVLAADYVLIG
jgi:hypothetical protein